MHLSADALAGRTADAVLPFSIAQRREAAGAAGGGQGAKAPATPLVIRRDLSQALGAVGLPARYQLARLIPMLSQGFDALRDAP